MMLKLKFARRILCVLLAAVCFLTPALAVTDWGLAFPKPGEPPVIDVSEEELRSYDALYLDKSGEKVLYLTFDAGYENGFTPSILDTLKRTEVPAAFFLVGHYLKTAPELVRRMCDEGHIVGNHTYHHPDMSKISDEAAFTEELKSLEKLFIETTGREMPPYYRPPQGKFSSANLALAKKLGYKTVFWSLAYADWMQDKQPSREYAMEKLRSRTHPGAVILLHSTSRTNAEILEEMIGYWKNEGYRFGTLDELSLTQAVGNADRQTHQ